MLKHSPSARRSLVIQTLTADFVVTGGGTAGVCSAITAARQGLKTVLVQDRPVLGGNASSEVRLWLLGATTHMGSNNRWAREGGVINEIMMENLWRNPDGNPLIFDTVLLEKVVEEENLTLLLNTCVFQVDKDAANPDRIEAVSAYCSQNETLYKIEAPLFCDASGDGVVGFLAGAAFRVGAEPSREFGEKFAPTGDFGHLLGHSIYFYSKDAGRPVKFVAPSFALRNIEKEIPRYGAFNAHDCGCKLWWIEWGGRLDTVHDTERIKWELWRIVYGVWDYIKNSGKFPESENLTLEWVGHIPGKRESRRFEGDYMLSQQDIVERRKHADAVAYGGWSIDLHPADGVFAKIAGAHHLHSKGIYGIPYRCYYSRNIENLFLAGRIISASHVAFGSTRVMATCALGGQAVGHAAALCREFGELPCDILKPERMTVLHRRLGADGHHVPAISVPDPENFASEARVSATSSLRLAKLPPGGPLVSLEERATAQMIPLPAGPVPAFTLWADSEIARTVKVALRTTSDPWHHTPDVTLGRTSVSIPAGKRVPFTIALNAKMPRPGYAFLIFSQTTAVALHTSELRVTGLLRLEFRYREQTKAGGGENFDIFAPPRRPGGQNLAIRFLKPLESFEAENVVNGWQRPTHQPNAWVAEPEAPNPELRFEWDKRRVISEVTLHFDGDFDHAMETVWWAHPERAVPLCVRNYELLDGDGNTLVVAENNHHSRVRHRFKKPTTTAALTLRIRETWGAPAAVFEVRMK
ncbi:MAG TPA: FAD-dependent oxidoreductase [Chthoniobacterales bacterium]